MNGLERVMATLPGIDTDYQPFTMLLSLYGASLIKTNTIDYYQDAELWFQGQKATVEAFDPDILISPFSITIEAEAFGSQLAYLKNYPPNIKKPIITELSQIESLQLPDLNNSPSLKYLLYSTSLLAKNYNKTKAIAAPVNSPCDIPALLMGIEMWLDTLLFHKKEASLIMEKTALHFVRMGNEYLKRGATFLVVPANFTNPMIITEKIFDQMLPFLENAFSQIKGPIVIHNGGCKLMPFIDRFAKLPNVIAMVLDPHDSFEQARQIIGNKMVLMGNLDGPNLFNLSKEEAIENSLKILNDRKDDKHFIFATSNADIPYDTPIETIKAVVESIRNFKK